MGKREPSEVTLRCRAQNKVTRIEARIDAWLARDDDRRKRFNKGLENLQQDLADAVTASKALTDPPSRATPATEPPPGDHVS